MALRLAYLTLHRRTGAVVGELGITADQFVVLLTLGEGAALSQTELAERTATDRNTLRAMLLLLERAGVIHRKPNPSDRRVWRVSLTPLGRKTLQQSWRQSESLRQELSQTLPGGDVKSLVELLRSLTLALSDVPEHDCCSEHIKGDKQCAPA